RQLLEPIPDPQRLQLRAGAEILTVGDDEGRVALWYLADQEQPLEIRTFVLIPNGREFDTVGRRYIGSVRFRDHGRRISVHLFEIREES
ncbi:MAG TPA: hypothetical protein VKQ71_03620, partial [Acidimicrobiales bacterium]|nr:hypothetical protein [Acidimicrobiales bacterium]